jgi:hypothetical protein
MHLQGASVPIFGALITSCMVLATLWNVVMACTRSQVEGEARARTMEAIGDHFIAIETALLVQQGQAINLPFNLP